MRVLILAGGCLAAVAAADGDPSPYPTRAILEVHLGTRVFSPDAPTAVRRWAADPGCGPLGSIIDEKLRDLANATGLDVGQR